MAVQKVEITHNGEGLGQVYLSDIGRRNSLGGGVSVYENGQDCYLNPGETIELVATSQVLLSIDRGVIKKFSSGAYAGALTVSFVEAE